MKFRCTVKFWTSAASHCLARHYRDCHAWCDYFWAIDGWKAIHRKKEQTHMKLSQELWDWE